MKPKPLQLWFLLNPPLALVHHTLSALVLRVHPTQAFGTQPAVEAPGPIT